MIALVEEVTFEEMLADWAEEAATVLETELVKIKSELPCPRADEDPIDWASIL